MVTVRSLVNFGLVRIRLDIFGTVNQHADNVSIKAVNVCATIPGSRASAVLAHAEIKLEHS